MGLTTIDAIKARIPISGTAEDEILTSCLAAAELQIARWCGRCRESVNDLIDDGESVEEYLDGGGETIAVARYPIRGLTDVRESSVGGFDDVTPLTEWQDYTVDPKAGLIHRVGLRWLPGRRSVRVRYTGGFAAAAIPADLAEAALRLAVLLYKSGLRVGEQAVASGKGNVTWATPAEMPPEIAGMIRPFRRMMAG